MELAASRVWTIGRRQTNHPARLKRNTAKIVWLVEDGRLLAFSFAHSEQTSEREEDIPI